MKYAVIDIETTGGSRQFGKITEIAIYVFDGEKVIDSYETLINPGIRIPYAIQQLTGISNEMVAGAPFFYQIAKKVVEITEGCIFVAHNVGFDYGFIRSEFKALGFEYDRKKLCTVRLSRKLIPGQPTYSLGKLCKALGIELVNAHRAGGDAKATVELLKLLMAQDNSEKYLEGQSLSTIGLNPNLDPEVIKKLPNATGVYYFFDDNKQLIYVGKSKKIRSRVYSHFNNSTTKKAVEMKYPISEVKFEITGSELIALLLESDEIKKYKPYYNRAQRRTVFSTGVYARYSQEGYIQFEIQKNKDESVPLASFSSGETARKYLINLVEDFSLCQKHSGIYKTGSSCFLYNIKKCAGACVGKESPDAYNLRAEKAIKALGYSHPNMIIMDKGRKDGERSVINIENGKYQGFGFVETELFDGKIENLRVYITPFADTRDVQQIIKSFIRRGEITEIIPYP